MRKLTFVVGGCRSGKSRFALEQANAYPNLEKVFIATCVPADEEMRQRVARHQQERGPSWSSLECPIDLPGAVKENSAADRLLLVDCLTLWVSNLILQGYTEDVLLDLTRELTLALEKVDCPVFLVSNEVGAGIVPENKLSRVFRDQVGLMNQHVASRADKVYWMVAGIPINIA